MNQMHKQLSLKPTLANNTKSYCKRNNINEKQFLKAIKWYQSAISNSKKNK